MGWGWGSMAESLSSMGEDLYFVPALQNKTKQSHSTYGAGINTSWKTLNISLNLVLSLNSWGLYSLTPSVFLSSFSTYIRFLSLCSPHKSHRPSHGTGAPWEPRVSTLTQVTDPWNGNLIELGMAAWVHGPSYCRVWGRKTTWAQEFEITLGSTARSFQQQ